MSTERPDAPIAIIADDEDLGRLLLEEAAAECGLSCLTFGDGAAALDAARERDVAIVLLDVDMPGLNGYEVCRALREDVRFATVPIVMVTGHEDSQAIRLAFEAGATDFISKPVNWALLPRRLEYFLRNAATAERIERLAYFDTLTGLANRQRCIDVANNLFRRAASSGESVAVLYLDLNHFKRVNDTFGHGIGDEILRIVADRLRRAVERVEIDCRNVLLSRFGGDEFVILIAHADARNIGLSIAEKCQDAFRDAVRYGSLEFYTGPSLGMAVYPEDGSDVTTVFKHADTAMYYGKTAGFVHSVVTYTSVMSTRLRDWLELEARLRRALHEDLLSIAYQPKFRIQDQQMVGAEVLLRWCDSEFGQVPPTRFVEIAEDSGLIMDIGVWVMRSACRQLRKWMDRGFHVPLAINCSGKELLHGDPARALELAATEAGVPVSLIEIEITESLLVRDSAAVQNALQRLRQLGCKIALDDFGTGYSSLAYITRFPPDRIKIDKAFVRNVDTSASDAAVASAILSLGASLNVIVTAEGVERPAQLEWLKGRGCHDVQGYLLSRPLPAAEFERRFLVEAGCREAPESVLQDAKCVS